MTLLDWLQQNPPALYGALLLLGLVVGSFLNVVILRLPRMLEASWRADCQQLLAAEAESHCAQSTHRPSTAAQEAATETGVTAEGAAGPGGLSTPASSGERPLSLAYPPSHCPACGHAIRPWHNIPVLGYLLLRGRCHDCRAPIAIRYPLIELFTGLATVCVGVVLGLGPMLVAGLALTWALIALAGIDADTQLLPDNITLPLLWAGLLFHTVTGELPLADVVIGAAAGYLLLWSIYWVFRLSTGKEGMGYGDFKLLAALGAWLGWQALPMIILLSSVVGAVAGGALMLLRGRGRDVPMPFGPYLAAAGWLCLLWGPAIEKAWFGLLGIQ